VRKLPPRLGSTFCVRFGLAWVRSTDDTRVALEDGQHAWRHLYPSIPIANPSKLTRCLVFTL
jgi:hypothetical protein